MDLSRKLLFFCCGILGSLDFILCMTAWREDEIIEGRFYINLLATHLQALSPCYCFWSKMGVHQLQELSPL
jgi:hypothetical protein